jgi:membrane protein CcdC involved in cytochrome C biogenesis
MLETIANFILDSVTFVIFAGLLYFCFRELKPLFIKNKEHWKKMAECKKFREEPLRGLQKEHIKEIVRLSCSWGAFCFAWILLAITFKYPENGFSLFLTAFIKGSQANMLEAVIWGVIVSVCIFTAKNVHLKTYWGFGLRCTSLVILTVTTVLAVQLGPTAETSLFASLGKIITIMIVIYVGASIKMGKLHQQPKTSTKPQVSNDLQNTNKVQSIKKRSVKKSAA